jgi:hypothetical protein
MKLGIDTESENEAPSRLSIETEDLRNLFESTQIETNRDLPDIKDGNNLNDSPIMDKNPPPTVLNFDSESSELNSYVRVSVKRVCDFTPRENTKRLKVLNSLNESVVRGNCLDDGTPLSTKHRSIRRNLMEQFGSLETEPDSDFKFIEPESTLNFIDSNLDSMDRIMESFIRFELDADNASYQHFVFQTTLSKSMPIFSSGTVQLIDEFKLCEPTRKLAFEKNQNSKFLMDNHEFRLEVI